MNDSISLARIPGQERVERSNIKMPGLLHVGISKPYKQGHFFSATSIWIIQSDESWHIEINRELKTINACLISVLSNYGKSIPYTIKTNTTENMSI
jgi:hypothetical protein